MYNPICTQTQRKLLFIPFANVAILFIWLHNCKWNGNKLKNVFWGSLKAIASLLPFVVIQFLCAQYLSSLAVVSACLVIYFAPMLMGYVLIRQQEAAGKNKSFEASKPVAVCGVRKSALFILPGVFFVLLVVVPAIFIVINDYQDKRIPDQNGSTDHSLAVLTMNDLMSDKMSSLLIGTRVTKRGDSTDVPDRYAEYDCDVLTIAIRSVSGVRTIHATKATCDKLMLSVSSTLQTGNAAIIVLVDGEFYCDVDINTADSFTIKNVSDKLVEVRLAGESAQIEVSVTRIIE